jgi:hypothetical protein
MERIGNYIVEVENHPPGVPSFERWGVRADRASEYLSLHDTKEGAIAAAKRYGQADQQRTK